MVGREHLPLFGYKLLWTHVEPQDGNGPCHPRSGLNLEQWRVTECSPCPSPPLLLPAVGPSPQPLLPVQLREWLGRLPGPEAGQAAAAFGVRPCSGGLGRARASPQLSGSLESLPAPQPNPFHLTPLDTQASRSRLADSGLPFSLAEAGGLPAPGLPCLLLLCPNPQLALCSSAGF